STWRASRGRSQGWKTWDAPFTVARGRGHWRSVSERPATGATAPCQPILISYATSEAMEVLMPAAPAPSRLTDEAITTALANLDGWERDGDQIVRAFEFADFVEAFGFLARVAILQEKADHHAETWGVYNKVR